MYSYKLYTHALTFPSAFLLSSFYLLVFFYPPPQ